MAKVAMQGLLVALVFVVIGVVSIVDGIRINNEVRMPGIFDVLGPDRYLIVLGAILVLCGLGLAASDLRGRQAELAAGKGDEGEGGGLAVLAMFILLALHAALMPYTGYLLGTAAFMALALLLMGVRGWKQVTIATVATAVIFHVLFEGFADMALPAGPLPSPFGF